MKPISLKIQGLNSFEAQEQTIDFEALSSSGLFGIFGRTGSGKTSIIDAITLSLYGKMSGGRRQNIFINANSSLCFVSLTFSVNDDIYTISRTYKTNKERTSITSGKTILQNNTTEEILADKVSEVDKKILALLGLGYEDFTRTVVLPQGKFNEFLAIAGADRRKMLERIFDLEIYGDKLDNSLSEVRDKKNNSYLKILNKIELLGEPTEEKIKCELSKQEELSTQLTSLEETHKTTTTALNRLEQTKLIYDKLKTNEESLAKLLQKNDEIEKNANLLKKIKDAKQLQPFISEYIETKSALNLLETKLISANKTIENLKIKEETLTKKQKELDDTKAAFTTLLVKKQNVLEKTQELKEKNTLSLTITSLLKEHKLLKEEIKSLNLSLTLHKEKKEKFTQDYTHTLEKLTENQSTYIAMIAKQLKKNTPCPVCGSVAHPNIFNHTSHRESGAHLDFEEIKNMAAQIKIEIDKLTLLIEETEKLIQNKTIRQEQVAVEGKVIREKLDNLDAKLFELTGGQEVNSFLSEIESTITSRELLENNLKTQAQDTQREKTNAQSNLASLTGEINTIAELHKKQNTKIQADLLLYGFTDTQEVNKLVMTLNEETLQKQIDDFISKKQELEISIKTLRENDFTGIDQIEELSQKNASLSAELKEKSETLSISKNQTKQMQENLETYTLLSADKKDLEKELDILTDLRHLFKGKQFVEFVAKKQLTYIAKEANQRILEMTSGSYGLTLEDSDFYVVDYRNGGIHRHPSTLSGGEVFMVSLCLALALSSKIQLKSTSSLDFFFLDEGFGTLDMETLDSVMDILTTLPNNGTRSVGVISHVEEMKERIEKKIFVEKQTTGGSIIQHSH